jgi:hypothetical protein
VSFYYRLLENGSVEEIADPVDPAIASAQIGKRIVLSKPTAYEVPMPVSTVFLAIDHNYGRGNPILFETMLPGLGSEQSEIRRYFTIEEALDGHIKAAREVWPNGDLTTELGPEAMRVLGLSNLEPAKPEDVARLAAQLAELERR